jgi:hypothetical protein
MAPEEIDRLVGLLRSRPALCGIVRLLIAGSSRKQIAQVTGRSIHTVDWHLRELYRICPGITPIRLATLCSSSPVLKSLLRD